MNTLFHVAPTLLGEGSIILPGNFGRIVKRYNPSSVNFDILTRETIFEQIRQQEFKDKPSRLHCLFLLETLEQAIQYKNQYAAWNLVYEVSINNESPAIHKGSYSFNIRQPVQGLQVEPLSLPQISCNAKVTIMDSQNLLGHIGVVTQPVILKSLLMLPQQLLNIMSPYNMPNPSFKRDMLKRAP